MNLLSNRKKSELTALVLDADGDDEHSCWNERERTTGTHEPVDRDAHEDRMGMEHNLEWWADRDALGHYSVPRR